MFDLWRVFWGAGGANTDLLDRSAQAARSILVSPYGSRRGSAVSQAICASGREAPLPQRQGRASEWRSATRTRTQALSHFTFTMLLSTRNVWFFLGEIRHWKLPRAVTPTLALGRRDGIRRVPPRPSIIRSSVSLLIEYLSMSPLSQLQRGTGARGGGGGEGQPIPLSGRCGAENQARYSENAKQEPHALSFPPTMFV